jgi:hypothetical protein
MSIDVSRKVLVVLLLSSACSSSTGGGDDTGDDFEDTAGCTADQAFDQEAGECIDAKPGSGDLVGEVMLFQQTNLEPTDVNFANPGKAEAQFWMYESLPTDDRTGFTTEQGEKCKFDLEGDNYPSYVDGKTWPDGDIMAVGDVTIDVAGGPGPIMLEETAIGSSTAYYHRMTPPPITSGLTTYGDFFAASYVPVGKNFSVSAAGGTDLEAVTWRDAGPIPESPIVTEPNWEDGSSASATGGLTVKWETDNDPTARIQLSLSVIPESGVGAVMMRCDLEDDGEVTLPADELAPFTTMPAAFYISREISRTIVTPNGGSSRSFIRIASRNDRFRLVTISP